MWNQISGVSDDEHVAYVGFGKSGRQHTAVHTSEKQSFRLWVVFHLYELLHHFRPIRPPVFHYASKYPVHVCLSVLKLRSIKLRLLLWLRPSTTAQPRCFWKVCYESKHEGNRLVSDINKLITTLFSYNIH